MPNPSPEFVALQEVVAGRYSLERETNRGPLLIRFQARDVRLERPVTIELLRPDPLSRTEIRERFMARARAAAGLFHPHIVPVHAVEERDGLAFLVHAHDRGETLGDRVAANGPLRPSAVRRLVEEIAWALEHAHAQGLVHGSLDPAHILLDAETGRTVVTGFGTGVLPASLASKFRAPERNGDAPPDVRGDLFALGACARFALTGRNQEAVEGGTPEDRRLKPVRGSDELPPQLARTIVRCIAPDPQRRPGSAAEVAAEVAAPDSIPSNLPASARRLLRRIRQFSPAVVIGLVVLWFTRDASAQAAVTALVGGGLGFMGLGLVRAARDALRDGFDRDLVTRVLETEAEELASHPDARPHKFQNFAIGCGGLSFVIVMVPAVLLLIATTGSVLSGGGLLGYSMFSHISAAGALLVTLLFLAGPSEPAGSPRRWLDFGERMMVGRFGRLLFRLAGVGLGGQDARESNTLGEPTALALSNAVEELFAKLPADVRRSFAEAPTAVHDLREHVGELHKRERELSEALVGLEGVNRPDVAGALEGARARVRERLSRATASLEHLRLGMLRLAARSGSEAEAASELTVQLERARRIRADADELILGRDEVRRLLDGSGSSGARGD